MAEHLLARRHSTQQASNILFVNNTAITATDALIAAASVTRHRSDSPVVEVTFEVTLPGVTPRRLHAK